MKWLFALFFPVGSACAAEPQKPNILVIIADDQGWADIGYNNPGKVHTPHLDQLAATGATFTRHYVMPQQMEMKLLVRAGFGIKPGFAMVDGSGYGSRR